MHPHITKSRPSSGGGSLESLPPEPCAPLGVLITDPNVVIALSPTKSRWTPRRSAPPGHLSQLEPESQIPEASGAFTSDLADEEQPFLCDVRKAEEADSPQEEERARRMALLAGVEKRLEQDLVSYHTAQAPSGYTSEPVLAAGDQEPHGEMESTDNGYEDTSFTDEEAPPGEKVLLSIPLPPFLTSVPSQPSTQRSMVSSTLGTPEHPPTRIVWSEQAGEYVDSTSRVGTPSTSGARTPAQIGNTLDAFLEQQECVRLELQTYMTELHAQRDDEGNPFVEFPEHFDDVVEVMREEGHALSKVSKWARYLIDGDADTDEVLGEHKKIRKGLARVRELDLQLVQKTREAKAQRKALHHPPDDCGDDEKRQEPRRFVDVAKLAEATETDMHNMNPDARYFSLKPHEEARVEAIMADSSVDEEELRRVDLAAELPNAFVICDQEHGRLEEIDAELSAYSTIHAGENISAKYADDTKSNNDHTGSIGEYSKKVRRETDWLREERLRREEAQHLRHVETSLHRLRVQAWAPPSRSDAEEMQHLVQQGFQEGPLEDEAPRLSALLQEMRQSMAGIASKDTPSRPEHLPVSEIHRRMRESDVNWDAQHNMEADELEVTSPAQRIKAHREDGSAPNSPVESSSEDGGLISSANDARPPSSARSEPGFQLPSRLPQSAPQSGVLARPSSATIANADRHNQDDKNIQRNVWPVASDGHTKERYRPASDGQKKRHSVGSQRKKRPVFDLAEEVKALPKGLSRKSNGKLARS